MYFQQFTRSVISKNIWETEKKKITSNIPAESKDTSYFPFRSTSVLNSRQLLLVFTYTLAYPVLTEPHPGLTLITFTPSLGTSSQVMSSRIDSA